MKHLTVLHYEPMLGAHLCQCGSEHPVYVDLQMSRYFSGQAPASLVGKNVVVEWDAPVMYVAHNVKEVTG